MATTAAPWSMPYPVGTDRVMDGDDVIHALADRVHAKLTESLTGVPVAATTVALAGTWAVSGAGVKYAMRSGIVAVTVEVSKPTAITGGETIAIIPAGYRPTTNVRTAVMIGGSGAPFILDIDATTGVLSPAVGTAAAGLYGYIVYPLP